MGDVKQIRYLEAPKSARADLHSADLESRQIKRWVASRKAQVVKAVEDQLLSKEDALKQYNLSDEEFESWRSSIHRYGVDALKVTFLQKFRNTN